MSNAIPFSGGTLPDPNKLATGQALRSDEVSRIPKMLNLSLNEGRCQPMVSQAWADRVCRYEVAGGAFTDAATWRIPMLTDSHLELDIAIYADAALGVGSGTVRFTSAGSGATKDFTVTAAGFYSTTFSAGLTTAAISATDYDDITMSISADTGQEIAVHSVTIRHDEIASVTLPAALIDGAEPFGVTSSFDPDYPLPSSMGRRFIEALDALRLRPRMLFCWSGLSADIVTYTGGEASETMGEYPHWLSSVINAGESYGGTPDSALTTWIKTRASATVETIARISQWGASVPAGSGDAWISLDSFNLVSLDNSVYRTDATGGGRAFSMPGATWASLVMGAESFYNRDVTSSAGILAVSVWGS